MKFVLVLFLGLLGVSTSAEVQELVVRDFRGGLVNGVANSLMQDNQAVVLSNFDIDPFGALTPRRGFTQVFNADTARMSVSKLLNYYVDDGKSLLAFLQQRGRNTTPSLDTLSEILVKCTNGSCSTLVSDMFYHSRFAPRSFPRSEAYMVNNNIVFVNGKSQLTLYDGGKAFPAVPVAPGQPVATPLDSVGTITGIVQYALACWDTLPGGTIIDTSMLSTPSSWISVHHGKVFVENLERYRVPGFSDWPERILVRRSTTDTTWKIVANIAAVNSGSAAWTTYMDTTSAPSVTFTEPTLELDGKRTDSLCKMSRTMKTPGAPGHIGTLVTTAGAGGGASWYPDCLESGGNPDGACNVVGYKLVFVDSAGRWSASAIQVVPLALHDEDHNGDDVPDSGWTAELLLEVPPSNIVSKYLVRYELPSCSDSDWVFPNTLYLDSTYTELWPEVGLIIADLSPATTNYDDENWLYRGGSLGGNHVIDGGAIEMDTFEVDDSLLTFSPSSITYHGDRMWAVGDPRNLNYLWYSDFGRPTTWPFDKFLKIGSKQGDWFVKVIGAENALIAFRQNSIVRLTGLSLFQFNVDEIVTDIGLGAVNSLGVTSDALYFMHKTGIYAMGRNGSTPSRLSDPIKASTDSISVLQEVVGNTVFGDYWMSYNGKTYIFSQQPVPHWKEYEFGLKDALLFDADTSTYDFTGDKYIFVKDNDSLYQYSLSANDTTDAGAAINCTYRSKFFFEGHPREKIAWVDLYGEGTPDTITVNLWADSTTIRKTVKVLPNFTARKVHRVIFNEICEQASIEIKTKARTFTLKGYTVGWLPWDRGKI